MSKTRIYFKGLNGLRFLSALGVMITHVELIKQNLGYPNIWTTNIYILNLGGIGVNFFFVLSGFLITYLLFAEKESTGTVGIKEFYLRRIYRIWPLYYLIMILGFFVFPNLEIMDYGAFSVHFEKDYWYHFFSYIFILPNVSQSFLYAVPHIGQSWSIGVEEQFYLIWPIILRFTRKPLKLFVWGTIGLISLKVLVLLCSIQFPEAINWIPLKKFLGMSRIECMTIGAIGAYGLYFQRERWLKLVFHPLIQLATLAMLPILLLVIPEALADGIHILYALLFIIIILNVSSNSSSFVKLENRALNFLGKISYGFYMYHMIMIIIAIRILEQFAMGYESSWFWHTILYILSFGGTVLVSWASYELFEKFFIRMKSRFSKVISGEEALLKKE